MPTWLQDLGYDNSKADVLPRGSGCLRQAPGLKIVLVLRMVVSTLGSLSAFGHLRLNILGYIVISG